jgi:mRNA interferase MazF
MTRNEAIGRLNEVFVVLATTNVRGLPTEVEVGPEDGLPRPCAFNADHTDTIAKGFLGERICELEAAKTAEVCRALNLASGC